MYNISDIFQFLPAEKVKASELKRGDIAKLHQRWELILDSHSKGTEFYNHGYDQEIILFNGCSYYNPEDEILIVQRNLINLTELDKFIEAHIKEQEELDRLADEEEAEREEEERMYLRSRLRELGD